MNVRVIKNHAQLPKIKCPSPYSRGGSRGGGGGPGGQDTPPPPFGGSPNFTKRENNVARMREYAVF